MGTTEKLEFDEFGSKLWTRPLGFLRFPPNFGFSPVESKLKPHPIRHHSYHFLSIARARNGDILGKPHCGETSAFALSLCERDKFYRFTCTFYQSVYPAPICLPFLG
jgi:hypothetical protein